MGMKALWVAPFAPFPLLPRWVRKKIALGGALLTNPSKGMPAQAKPGGEGSVPCIRRTQTYGMGAAVREGLGPRPRNAVKPAAKSGPE